MGLLDSIIKTFVGDKTKKDLKQISPLVDKINQYQKISRVLTTINLEKKQRNLNLDCLTKTKYFLIMLIHLKKR